MIAAVLIVAYVVALIVTATLIYLHVQDHPDWASTDQFDQVITGVGATLLWPVTLIVVATIQARSRWLNRDARPLGKE